MHIRRPRAWSQAHAGSGEPQHAKQQGTVTATGQGGQAERKQASGRSHAVSEGWGPGAAQDGAAHARLLTSPAAPLTTKKLEECWKE